MGTDTINPLLEEVGSDVAKEYYTALLHNLAAPGAVEVRPDAGGNRGKGLFAKKSFAKGEAIFQERPLVGIQELHSKLDTSTCANCFTAVGSVEQAFGGKICCLINELSEATEDDLLVIQERVDKIQAAVDSKRLEGLLSGQVQLPLSDKLGLCTTPVRCQGGCEEEYCSEACASKAWAHHHCLLCPGPPQQQPASSSCSKHSKTGSSSSSSGASSSTHSTQAPDTVHGARVNRTKLGKFLEHADDTNDIFRVAAQVIANTIITADSILQQAAADAAEGQEAAAAYSTAVAAAAAAAAAAAGQSAPQHVLAAAGPAAAKATAAQLAAAVPDEGTEQGVAAAAFQAAATAAAAGSSSHQVLAPATAADAASKPQPQQPQLVASKEQCLAVLKAAFLPYALGKKALWWDLAQEAREAAAAAGGGDSSGSDEDSSEDIDPAELAAQMRELAAESLALLRAGLQDARFPELFDLQLYGSLVGMFELNNLNLAVPAPVGRYKALLEDPPQSEGLTAAQAAAALHEVTPLLEALGEEADGPAEGTGFFALQSTMNHSCAPNAAADCDPSGQLVVSALQDIPAGAELLLSYIEEDGTDLAERRAMLLDYGFSCACSRCEAEALAASLQQQL